MKSALVGIMVAVLISLLVFITIDFEPDTDTIIEDAVKFVNMALVEVKKEVEFSDAKCYRDGEAKGIVLEFAYAEAHSSKTLSVKVLKTHLAVRFKNNFDLWRFAEMGIYYKCIYKDFSGKELYSFKLAKEDFGSASMSK